MTKRTIVETVEEYNENGVLLKRTVTETHEDDDAPAQPRLMQTWIGDPPVTTPLNPYITTPINPCDPSITAPDTDEWWRKPYVYCGPAPQATLSADMKMQVVDCNMPEDCETCSSGCRQ